MKFTHLVASAFLFSIIVSSCVPRYIPNRQNVPMLQEKNEFRASVNPRNLQLAYSPMQGLGIMANGFYMEQSAWRVYSDDDTERARQFLSLAEIGLGYYCPISPDSAWRFEIYSGYGTGNARIHLQERTGNRWLGSGSYDIERNFNARQNRFFVQPAIGYSSEYFEAAFSTRISALSFLDIRLTNFTSYTEKYYGLEELGKRRFLLAEPALTLRAGPKYVKFEAQIGYTSRLNYSEYSGHQYVRPWIFVNFGLHATIAPRFWR